MKSLWSSTTSCAGNNCSEWCPLCSLCIVTDRMLSTHTCNKHNMATLSVSHSVLYARSSVPRINKVTAPFVIITVLYIGLRRPTLSFSFQIRLPYIVSIGSRVQQASSMRNFTLSCLPRMLSEDLKKSTFSCCQTHIQVWLLWVEVILTRIQVINILKHTAISQTLVKQLYSAGSPVTWGSLETRELTG